MKIHILAAAAAAFIAFAPAGAQGNGAASNTAAAANAGAPAGSAAAADMVQVPADTGNATPPAAVGNVDDVDTAATPLPPPHGFPWGILGLIGLVGLLPLFRRSGGDS